jgi:hypothetical protein
MQFQKIFVPLASVLLMGVAYRAYGWSGVALVAGALVMWLLMHFTRMMQVFRRAADRPLGFVDSAVMLNAKLRPGVSLLHVVAMTRSLGEQLNPKDSQPELFRWTDASASSVTCEFRHGKLASWSLARPAQAAEADPPPPVAPAP